MTVAVNYEIAIICGRLTRLFHIIYRYTKKKMWATKYFIVTNEYFTLIN